MMETRADPGSGLVPEEDTADKHQAQVLGPGCVVSFQIHTLNHDVLLLLFSPLSAGFVLLLVSQA